MDEKEVWLFLDYFKSKEIKEEKFLYLIETLCEGAL